MLSLLILAAAQLGAAGAAEAKYASIVIDADTGEVLQETNADTRLYPASLTKMMTLYMLFEALQQGEVKLTTKLAVSKHAAAQQPSKLGLKAGNTITVENAIRALVTKSANDVAVVVAEALGGTESGFAAMMTKKARALGMSRTNFYNASGLPDSRQKSTARDMARLSLALLRDFPQQYTYFSTKRFTYAGATFTNHNRLLGVLPGVDGIKTGYTKASGYNIALSAVRDGRRIITVVFGGQTSTKRNVAATDLINDAFAKGKGGGKKDKVVVAKAAPSEKPALKEAKAAPPATQVAALETMAVDASLLASGWQIQVGAFSRYESAQAAASDAGGRARALLQGARVHIVEVDAQGNRLYRARLADLSETQARNACQSLKQQALACLVVAPGS